MNFLPEDYYRVQPGQPFRPAAIFRDIPVPFFSSGRKLVTISASAQSGVNFDDFYDNWRRRTAEEREAGIPLLVRAKLRPALLLRVGGALQDRTHADSFWVAPLYSRRDHNRIGPNIFPLPAHRAVGLDADGFLDFYHILMVPAQHFAADKYLCHLTSEAERLLLGAIERWSRSDPSR
jgi:hypothetical protein